MKVAFLSFDFGEYCIRLANALASKEEVLLLLPDNQVQPRLALLNQTTNLFTFRHPRLRQPLQQMQLVFSLLRHIKAWNPDVIHFQHRHLWFNFALPLLRRYPLVLTVHDPTPHVGDLESQKCPQAVMNFGFRRAAQLIVHGEQLKHVVVNQLHIPAEIVHVIPHVVIGNEMPPQEITQDEQLVLFFGRIWEYKGLEYLIRAEPLITAQVPGARIMIAGEGEDFARYRRMMVNPEHFIVLNEYVSDEQRDELFRRCSIVALPYIDASQSGVIPLAYTSSKPVVATTVGGLPEMVEDGRTGYLVPPRDEKALADAIVRLLQNQDLCRQMGTNGKRKLDSECSEEVVAQKTLAVYARALNGVKGIAVS